MAEMGAGLPDVAGLAERAGADPARQDALDPGPHGVGPREIGGLLALAGGEQGASRV
jgi:hypothetical protein